MGRALAIGTLPDGELFLSLLNNKKNVATLLANGDPGLHLYDKEGKSRLRLSPDEGGMVGFYSASGALEKKITSKN